MCKISIIVPIYNVERYVNRCIESILFQTYKEFELILVNDGSTDRCHDICDEYERKDPRIIVIHQNNAGVSSARNAGLDIASGEYITFIDGDDFIHPLMLETLHKNIRKTNTTISICNFREIYDQQKLRNNIARYNIKVISGARAVEEITNKRKTYMISPWAKLYDIKLFDNLRFPNVKYHEDEYVTYKLLFDSKFVSITKDKLYYYLQHSNSAMNRPFNSEKLVLLEALEDAINFFRLKNNEKLANQATYRYLFSIQIVFYKAKFGMNDSEEITNSLLDRYKLGMEKYYKISKNNILFYRRILLKFFSISPNLYTSVIKGAIGIIEFFKRKK